MSERVARSRELVAKGFAVAAVARVLQISRQAIYRTPTPRRPPRRRPPVDEVEGAIVWEALANQTDGYRMITAFVRRKLGRSVNRKRVRRVLRERKLIQRRRPLERRKRPGFIESWFGKLKQREVWLNEYEILGDARDRIGGYVDRYHHRPHSGLDYRTPTEVRGTWEDLQKTAA